LPRLGRIKYVSVASGRRRSPKFLAGLREAGVRVECRWPVITAREWGYYGSRCHPEDHGYAFEDRFEARGPIA